ncbi:MAG: hypothetical protein HYV09_24800 [Deltaproteobacteria bacterium]|nr:hypothetical protein [Deltaproteobacteria bacterium]
MPKDLIDNAALFPTPVSVPRDGDLATGGAFEVPYQQLANRTAYLREQIETHGVRRVRRSADFGALRGVADMQALDVRWVTGHGVYWYDAATSDAEEPPWSVKPSSGVGLWRHTESARRTEVGRAFHRFFTVPLSTVNSEWTDAGLAVTLRGAHAREWVQIHLHGDFRVEGLAGVYRVAVIESDGTLTELPEMAFGMWPAAGTQPRAFCAVHRVGVAGDVNVKVQFKTLGASANVQILGPAALVAQLVRP